MHVLKISDKKPEKRIPEPRNDQVVVKPLPNEEEITNGGLIVPASAKGHHNMVWARVVAVGPGGITSDGTRIPINLNAGDVIGMSLGGGTTFMLNGEQYASISDGAIQIVLREGNVLQ